ncbi:starch-binding protein [Paenibacillus stellifer]|uniref:starch-binding protein n=1 Tax=Paenibacillus stellifer TaxID=169760 RepID=UPI000A054FE9|nr:starch-binding protein [Paenibacillus stellifer]
MKKRIKPLFSTLLFAVLLLQTLGFPVTPGQSSFVSVPTVQAAAADYGLPAKTSDGVIFHAWNWSFDNIKNNLPAIAAAGFKSIQTSPIQPTKESSTEGSKWWLLYQPTYFSVGNTQLGSRDQFQQLCTEADKYGISIIVDVVANHTANAGGGSLTYTPASNVDPVMRNNSSFWHEAKGISDYNNRWQVTQWGIGLPDLNTGNQDLQNMVISFLNDAVSLGADGFRFDAAKHIELPDDSGGSNFWTRVLGSLNNRSNLYIYGEVLQGGADRFADYANYINLAAPNYGHNIRNAVGFGTTVNASSALSYDANNVSPTKLVTWVESHDTYANDSNESTGLNDWQIKTGWAIIASRAQTTSLFFDRPGGSGKFGTALGQTGSTLWQDPDIAAVNKFHNAMVGQTEYLRTQGSQILLVDRGTVGTTIVNLGGDASINSPTSLADGTYVNKASAGGTFTVSGGKITGNLGGGKIAVLYNAVQPVPTVTVDKAEGAFTTDSLAVNVSVTNADSASYSVNNGTPVSFSSNTSVNLGAGAAFGTSFALKVTAANAAGTTVKTFTYVKTDPNAALVVHYYKPSSWGTPNIYYYDDTVTPTKIGAAWPGTAMTSETGSWYSYSIAGWTKAKVIFNSGSNQMPAAQQAGYSVTGESWIKDGVIYTSNPDVVEPTITIDKAEGTFTTDSLDVTVTYSNATSASYTLNGSASASLTSGQKISFGAGAASGTTYTLTVTASNASKTTTKTFTFTKQTAQALTVHYYKPSSWGTPNIYYYDDTVTPTKIGAAWPGAAMTSEGNGWYSYSISGWSTAKVIFNSGSNQVPAAQQAGYSVSGESWIKDGVITTSNPDVAAPTITIDKAEGTFTTDSLDVTVTYSNATSASYTLNDSASASLASGQKVTLGAGAASGTVYTLTVTAANASKTTTKTFTFTKQTTPSFTVHFYKPSAWGTPNIYYYDDSVSPTKTGGAWPGSAMTSEGDGWYSYTISNWSQAYVIFNSNGQQTPASQQRGYLVTQNSWIKDGVITTTKP